MLVDSTGHKASILGYYLLFILVGISWSIVGPSMLTLIDQTDSSLNRYGLIFIVEPVGFIIGSLLGGHLYERYPGHRVMVIFLVGMAIFRSSVPFINDLGMLIFVASLSATSAGILEVGGNIILIWIYKEKAAPYLNALHFFMSVGFFLGPALIALIITMNMPIAMIYWVLGVMMLPLAVYIGLVPGPNQRTTEAKSVALQHNLKTDFILLVFLVIIAAGVEKSLGDWSFVYSLRSGVAVESTASIIASAFWGSLAAGRILVIPFTVRFRTHKIVFTCLMGCLASITILLIWPRDIFLVWIGFIGMGLSLGPIVPNLIAFSANFNLPVGQMNGILMAAIGVGGMTLPFIISQGFELIGPKILLYIAATGIVGSFLIYKAFRSLTIS